MQMLNADIFLKSDLHYQKQFEFILAQITRCYFMMLGKYKTIENNEILIRNRFYKDFLENNKILEYLGLNYFFFDIESPEIDDSYQEKGRADIKVYNASERMHDRNAYYIIECKRLDGNMTLNREYIKEGIRRFAYNKYPSHFQLSGMLGFVIKDTDMHENIKRMNLLIKQDYLNTNTLFYLKQYIFMQGFNFSYISVHTTLEKKEIRLYHLMWDFSKIIEN